MAAGPPEGEDLERLRRNIAEANGFALYKQYTEPEAAGFLQIHPQTLKSHRLEGKIEFLRLGKRSIGYFGFQLADFLIGAIAWRDAKATPTPPSPPVRKRKPAAIDEDEDALRMARNALKKPGEA